jgi:signal transduction histidine kinase
MSSIQQLFSGGAYIPHGHCYLWQTNLVWLHVASDGLIALAYYLISISLLYFVQRREDVPFRSLFWLFAAFIGACGTTHLLEIWTLWFPTYWVSGAFKALTALISLWTALELIPRIPKALVMPSSLQLEALNQSLSQEIAERKAAEAAVQKLNQELEERVIQRTLELETSQAELKQRATELEQVNGVLAMTTAVLEKRNKELDQFAYVASHDLKAPLRAVSNLSIWLEEDIGPQLPAENLQQLGLLRNRVQRMENLINGLLEYSRVGRQEQVEEDVNLNQLLGEVIDTLSPPPGFAIAVPDPLPTLKTRRLLLFQVFSNLISNAIKHHHQEVGKIEVTAKPCGNFIEFAVADDGPGIAPEFHHKVFSIFETLKSQDDFESTGIGLSVVKKVIESEGGEIHLASELGKGATFRFTWPKTAAS